MHPCPELRAWPGGEFLGVGWSFCPLCEAGHRGCADLQAGSRAESPSGQVSEATRGPFNSPHSPFLSCFSTSGTKSSSPSSLVCSPVARVPGVSLIAGWLSRLHPAATASSGAAGAPGWHLPCAAKCGRYFIRPSSRAARSSSLLFSRSCGWTPPKGATLLCGGEPFPPWLSELGADVYLYNVQLLSTLARLGRRPASVGRELLSVLRYGPTETTIWSTAQRVDQPAASAPGRINSLNSSLLSLDWLRKPKSSFNSQKGLSVFRCVLCRVLQALA